MTTFYRIRTGELRSQGYALDFDTLHLKPTVPGLSKKQRVTLRLAGVDGLESEFNQTHQPLRVCGQMFNSYATLAGLGDYSVNQMLQACLFVSGNPVVTVALGEVDQYGRVVSFVFLGSTPYADGDVVPAAELDVSTSLNYTLAAEGLALPYLTTSTNEALNEVLVGGFNHAQGLNLGLWALEETPNFPFYEPIVLFETTVVWPALFRYLVRFYTCRAAYTELAAFNELNRTVVTNDGVQTTFGALIDVDDRYCGISAELQKIRFVGHQ